MEDWFSSNQISEEEKTSYAEDTLTEDAFRIWEREAHIRLEYEEPDPSWEEMKQFLYQEFVEDVDNRRQYNLRIYTNPKPRRWILATKPKTTSKKACCPKPKEVLQSTIEKKIVAKEVVGAKEVRPELNLQVVARTLSTNPLLEPHDKLEQCKSSKASNVVDTVCYRCHRRGHFARVCPSRKTKPTSSLDSEIVETREVECVEPRLDNSNASIMHLLLSKFDEAGTRVDEKMPTQEATPSMDTKQKLIRHEEMSKPKQAKVSDHVLKLITNDPNTLMIHLICPKGVEKDLGVKEKPPDSLSQTKAREELDEEAESEIGNFTREANAQPKGVNNKPWRGVIASLLIKEEPPDPQFLLYRNGVSSQGKFLDSHLYRDTNLLYLGAGKEVSRTKLFQGRGYDEDIRSPTYMEHGIPRQGEKNKEVKQANETYDICSTQMKSKIDSSSSITTWNIHSTPLEKTTEKKYPKISPHEEDVEFTRWKTLDNLAVEADTDLWLLFDSSRINQEDSEDETNWEIFSAHLENGTKWNHPNRSSYEGVIQFSNQVTSNLSDLDTCALNGGYRPNQEELGYKPNCSGILVHQRIRESWNHANIIFGLEVIQFLNRAMLDLPYLEAHGFISGGITLQRLHNLCCYVLGTEAMYLDVPRQHYFMPKLSRLKCISTFLILADLFIIFQRLVFVFNLVDSFLVLDFDRALYKAQ